MCAVRVCNGFAFFVLPQESIALKEITIVCAEKTMTVTAREELQNDVRQVFMAVSELATMTCTKASADAVVASNGPATIPPELEQKLQEHVNLLNMISSMFDDLQRIVAMLNAL